MSKKYVEREAMAGGVLSPDSANVPLRTQQSSISSLDREQLPSDFVNTDRLAQYAMYRTYHATRSPASGEQNLQSSAVAARSWEALTAQNDPGTWRNFDGGSQTFSGFKGGQLFLEWSGNAFSYPVFAATQNLTYPLNPKYLNLRILINGSLLVGRRGVAYMEHFRIFGTKIFPPGDLVAEFQYRMTSVGPDDPLLSTAPAEYTQAHLFSSKFLAIGRWR